MKDNDPTFFVSEFFIMKKYRRNGIGRKTAFTIFDRFCGTWVVGQTINNIPAQVFWKKIIDEYTGGNFEEVVSSDWDGPLQKFNSDNLTIK